MRACFWPALLAAFLLLAGCARHATPAAPPSPSPSPRAAPTRPPVYSLLNGVQVAPKSGDHRIAAVMIDNYPRIARPQSGLHDADIVYEVEAEGGITRYMALFLESMPSKIGPVRSARTYFVDLARPYDPLFAHAGENDDVWGPLRDLREAGFADMDEIVGTPEAFWRDPTRDMPHNLYTSLARMRATAPKYGYQDMPNVAEEFSFAMPATPDPPASPEAAQPPAGHVGASPSAMAAATPAPEADVTFWNNYTVRFKLGASGDYERIITGKVQHDRDDPKPYKIADIIAVWIPVKVLDSLGDLEMNVYGSYPAVLVRAGEAQQMKWVAPGPNTMPELLDSSGQAAFLSPGQIYIEVLPQGGILKNGKNIWSY